jgi:hypothetical protein
MALAEDIRLLNAFLHEKAGEVQKLPPTPERYRDMAEICLSQIIMFNRKRSGEAERITIKDYGHITDGPISDPAVMQSLTKFEQEMVRIHKRIEIIGKKSSNVTVIFTEEMISNLNAMMKMRESANVSSGYLFGKAGSIFPIRGCDCLRRFAKESGVKRPELLTSTKLRKQLATMSQCLNLNEAGQEVLARFMGHDIRVHRVFYQLPENTVQLAKVTKILHAINGGNSSDYNGKDLKDVVLDENGKHYACMCMHQGSFWGGI